MVLSVTLAWVGFGLAAKILIPLYRKMLSVYSFVCRFQDSVSVLYSSSQN